MAMTITPIESGAKYDVESDSGKTYRVTYCGSGDADPDYVSLWKCDCPAGKFGRTCKHIHAVADYNERIDDDA